MNPSTHLTGPAHVSDAIHAAQAEAALPAGPPCASYAEDVLSGDGAAVTRLRLQLSRIAPHFRTAIITGERGVGKETVAREMHRLSGAECAAGPFQPMEMTAFANQLQPVELRGVLFLKGLDTLEPPLQEKAVQRLRAIQREVRIIVASDCELRIMLATGRMLQSLASRIGSLEIRVAPLRDRMDDLEAIAMSMMIRSRAPGWFGAEALTSLRQHSWPGNLAELASVVDHVAHLAPVDGMIEPRHLPRLVARAVAHESAARLDRVMQRHVFEVLERCAGNKLRTAELLGISRSTLYRMLETASEQAAQDTGEEAIATIERRVREGIPQERRVAAR